MVIKILSLEGFAQEMSERGITPDNVESKDLFCISINCTEDIRDEDHSQWFPEDKANVKVMYFDDVTQDLTIPVFGTKGKEFYHAYAFTEGQAKELVDFITAHSDKAESIIHCRAGISRSGAVGAFINDLYGSKSWYVFKRENQHISPNALIQRLLNTEARKRGLL